MFLSVAFVDTEDCLCFVDLCYMHGHGDVCAHIDAGAWGSRQGSPLFLWHILFLMAHPGLSAERQRCLRKEGGRGNTRTERERERERERDRDRDRDRDRETERETERQRETETETERQRQTDRQTETETERERKRDIDRDLDFIR